MQQPIAPYKRNRLLVVMVALSFASVVATILLAAPNSVIIATTVTALAFQAILQAVVRNSAITEEQHRDIRNKYYRRAYIAMMITLSGAVILALLLYDTHPPADSERTYSMLLLGWTTYLHLVLPTLILTWVTPIPETPVNT